MTDVRYRNDRLSDVVGVFLNTSEIGQFTSKAVVNSGDGRNVFQSSGQVGNPVQIYKGVYKLQIQLFKSSGKYGIEIDKVFLRFSYSSVSENNECPGSVIKVDITNTNYNGDKDGHSLRNIAEIIGSIVSILGVVIGACITIWKCYKKKSGTYSTIR